MYRIQHDKYWTKVCTFIHASCHSLQTAMWSFQLEEGSSKREGRKGVMNALGSSRLVIISAMALPAPKPVACVVYACVWVRKRGREKKIERKREKERHHTSWHAMTGEAEGDVLGGWDRTNQRIAWKSRNQYGYGYVQMQMVKWHWNVRCKVRMCQVQHTACTMYEVTTSHIHSRSFTHSFTHTILAKAHYASPLTLYA